jgi:hypothetical protein
MEQWTDEVLQQAADLGDGVPIPLTQGAVFQYRDGRNELYLFVNGSPGTFYAFEAETGRRIHAEKVPGVDSVTSLLAASDQGVYFSGPQTLFRYNPEQCKVERLGDNPCNSKTVWALEEAEAGMIFGACYPESKIFSYSMENGIFEDLGSMKEGEQYARGITAVEDQSLLVGIGTTGGVVEYCRITKAKTELPLSNAAGLEMVYKAYVIGSRLFVSTGIEVRVYDRDSLSLIRVLAADYLISDPDPNAPDKVYFKSNTRLYAYNWTSDILTVIDGLPPLPETGIKAFRWLKLTEGDDAGRTVLAGIAAYTETILFDPTDGWCRIISPEVDAEGVEIQSLECSPDGLLFLGGYQRGMSVFDPDTDRLKRVLPAFHQPEGITFWDGVPVFGTYRHARMYAGDWEQTEGPIFVLEIGERQDRPFALLPHGDQLYVGTIPTYGEQGGTVAICSKTESGEWTAEVHRGIVENQSITGLAVRNGMLFGGTSTMGGLGIAPKADSAVLFLWDLEQRTKIKEWVPHIPGLTRAPQLIGSQTFGPDGLLWGAMDADAALFALHPDTLEVMKTKRLYPEANPGSRWRPYYMRWGKDGLLYTSAGRRISVVDPDTMEHRLLTERSDLFCLTSEGALYYTRGSRLYKLKP